MEDAMKRLRDALQDTDAVLIGAGAGLSAAAGFTYKGERFHKYFADFEEEYGFQDMYAGGFYPFASLEEYWAYWSRYIFINRYSDAPEPVYQELFELIKDKDYFVLTTNVDHCFQKAGFDKQRLFYTQGDYGLFQCSEPCCRKTYDNERQVRQMVKCQNNRRIPAELIPRCPKCAKPMGMNLRVDHTFVEDEGWHRAAKRYETFLRTHKNTKLLLFELGVGMNTPGIIKFPFWRLTAENPEAVYVCVNKGEVYCPQEIEQQSICIDADIRAVLKG